MGFKMCLHNDTGTISAIPYAVLTLVIFGLFLVGMGVVVDALVEVDNQMMGMTTATTPRPTVAPTPTPTLAPVLVQVAGGGPALARPLEQRHGRSLGAQLGRPV